MRRYCDLLNVVFVVFSLPIPQAIMEFIEDYGTEEEMDVAKARASPVLVNT